MWQLLKVGMWRSVALLTFGLALLGVVLPGLPTTPFLLLSAWSAGKGWPRFEVWLLQHPRLGPPLQRWRQHGAVPRVAKWLAIVMMAASAVLFSQTDTAWQWQLALYLLFIVVAIWLWRRPEPESL